MAKRILVFQHIDSEHPWILRDFLGDDGVTWDTVALDRGDAIPDLDGYDGLWVMGGPMDVWEEDRYPWLAPEKAAIYRAVADLKLPFLGVCLGHQLLAEALGGKVEPSATPEIGVLPVHLSEAGRRHPLLDGVPDTIKCLQWHSAEVTRPPGCASILATSPACAVQALAVGDTALSVQFHVEIAADTVEEWGNIPAYRNALEENLGAGALENFRVQTDANIKDFNRHARTLYDNWSRLALA